MSYILRALRKAEKERKGDADADPDQWDSADWNSPTASSRSSSAYRATVAIILALLLAIFVLLWLLIGRISEPADFEPAGVAAIEVEQVQKSLPLVEEQIPVEAESPAVSSTQLERMAGDPELPVITGHLYFPANESLSRLFGETGSYREGHLFENGLRLMSISETQAVFEFDGKFYELALGD